MGHSGPLPPKIREKVWEILEKIFSKHVAPTLLSHYGSLSACKKVKNEELVLWRVTIRNTGRWADGHVDGHNETTEALSEWLLEKFLSILESKWSIPQDSN